VAQGKKITFKVPHVRGTANVSADRGMVTRAITNLVDNALKFTPEGGTIEVSILRDKAAMQVVVKDTGPGIAPENLDRIFERKVRIRQARQIRGLGLGLYIVKSVALKHGGRAWVESTPGEGSTFFLTLPVKPSVNGGT
jgi:signal transduction histidine kinase